MTTPPPRSRRDIARDHGLTLIGDLELLESALTDDAADTLAARLAALPVPDSGMRMPGPFSSPSAH